MTINMTHRKNEQAYATICKARVDRILITANNDSIAVNSVDEWAFQIVDSTILLDDTT